MIQKASMKNTWCAFKSSLFFSVLVATMMSAKGGNKNSLEPSVNLSKGVHTGSTAVTAPQTNLRQVEDRDEPLPPHGQIHGVSAGTRYIVEAPFISQVPLRIVVGSSAYAELCLYNEVPQNQLCVTIDSPLPAGMDLAYTDAALLDPDDDPRFLSFVPVIGNSDPQGWAASRFIDSLGKAAALWGNYLATHPQLVTKTTNAFRASGAGKLLSTGTAPWRSTHPNRMADSENCYAELEALGLCSNEPDDPQPEPDIPTVDVPGKLLPPMNHRRTYRPPRSAASKWWR